MAELDEAIQDPTSPEAAAGLLLAERQRAVSTAVFSLNDNPDDAARAQQLSRATNTSPAIVFGDLENFEKGHKAALTSKLLNNNEYLRDFAASHALAPKIANRDWGNLDALLSALDP